MLSGLKKLAQTVGVTSNTTKKMTPTTPEQEHQPVCARIRCIATVPASIPFIKCFNVTKSKISIGRSIDACDLILDSRRVAKMISRVHAIIERHETEDHTSMLGRMFRGKRKRYRWTIKDQSVNGLFVNDVRVSESPLNDGDTFTLGGGMTVKMGQTLPQPMSEFIFRWEVVDDVEEEEEEQKEQTPAAKRQRHALIDSESVTQDYSANGDEGSTQAADGMIPGHDEEGATLDFDAGKTIGNTDDMATQANDAHDGNSDDTATQAAGMPFGDEGATQAAPYGDGDEAADPDEVATP